MYYSSLEKITSLNLLPPICDLGAFSSGTKNTAVLYVPKGTVEDYSNATVWEDFLNIEEIDTSGIVGLTPDGAEIVGYYGIDG